MIIDAGFWEHSWLADTFEVPASELAEAVQQGPQPLRIRLLQAKA